MRPEHSLAHFDSQKRKIVTLEGSENMYELAEHVVDQTEMNETPFTS